MKTTSLAYTQLVLPWLDIFESIGPLVVFYPEKLLGNERNSTLPSHTTINTVKTKTFFYIGT